MRHTIVLSLLLLCARSACKDGGAACTSDHDLVLLVSSYFSNNVTRDGLCVEVLGSLDDEDRIRGAQATVLGANSVLYVVSAENRKVLRYDGSGFVDESASKAASSSLSLPRVFVD